MVKAIICRTILLFKHKLCGYNEPATFIRRMSLLRTAENLNQKGDYHVTVLYTAKHVILHNGGYLRLGSDQSGSTANLI